MSELRKMIRHTSKLSTGDAEVLARADRALRSSEADIIRRLDELGRQLQQERQERRVLFGEVASRLRHLRDDTDRTISYRLLRWWRSVVSFFTQPIGKGRAA